MAQSFEKIEKVDPIAEKSAADKNDIIERLYAEALNGESYEDATAAVKGEYQ